jgi:Nucleotidyl transferase AbiEii toxin, Type IV TA system
MGARGGQHPHESVPIGCLLSDVLEDAGTNLSEFADLKPFEVVALHPGRTLLEKLVHIHVLAQRLCSDTLLRADPRCGRHFYDVFQLLGDARVRGLLIDRDEFEQVMYSIEGITHS